MKKAMICTLLLSQDVLLGLGFCPRSSKISRENMRATRRRLFPGCTRGRLRVERGDADTSCTAVGATKGSWGSWGEGISQRDEQERILGDICQEEVKSGLRFRTGNKDDMLPITRLCVDTFRGPFEWWMLPLQLFQVGKRATSIVLLRLKLSLNSSAVESPHSLIFQVDSTKPEERIMHES